MVKPLRQSVLLLLSLALIGCAEIPVGKERVMFVVGFNEVRLMPEDGAQRNNHPVTLTPTEVGTLLHRVLYGEQRNFLHRLISREAIRRRAFREDEIVLLAPALSHALAQATPDERVFFHLGRPGSGGGEKGTTPLQTGMPGVALGRPATMGGEESTAGWIFVRGPLLHLLLSEVQHVQGPVADINQYIREMPNIPKATIAFTLTFDPEKHMVAETSWGSWLTQAPLAALAVRFREALADLQPYKTFERSEPSSR